MVNLIYSSFDFCETRFPESYVKSRREIKLSFAHICICCESLALKVSHSLCPNILIGRTVNSANKELKCDIADLRESNTICVTIVSFSPNLYFGSICINRKYNFNLHYHYNTLLIHFNNRKEFEFMILIT